MTEPTLVMAEGSEEEIEELAQHDVHPSVWLDDAPERLERKRVQALEQSGKLHPAQVKPLVEMAAAANAELGS